MLEGDDFEECSEGEEEGGVGDHGSGAGVLGQVLGEEAVGHAGGDEEEYPLSGEPEEEEACDEEQAALESA